MSRERNDHLTLDAPTLMSAIGEAREFHDRGVLLWSQHTGEVVLGICYYLFPGRPNEMNVRFELECLSPVSSPLLAIEVQGFPQGDGHLRWLFKCRVTNDGRHCDNHVPTLFLPVASMRKGFGCAWCHQIADVRFAVLRGANDEMTWWR